MGLAWERARTPYPLTVDHLYYERYTIEKTEKRFKDIVSQEILLFLLCLAER